MVRLLEINRQRTPELPVPVSILHMLARVGGPVTETERQSFIATASEIFGPFDEVPFAGLIDPCRLSFPDQRAARQSNSPMGEGRDAPRIEAWAHALAPKLVA